MLFLLQEGRLQRARKACSRMKKSIFLLQAWSFDEKRGTWQLKYLDNHCWNVQRLTLARVHSISHRFTQKNRTHKGPQRHQVNRYHRTLQLILVERPLCSLYAEGVLWARNVRQKAQWTLCALWEKKLPSESQAVFLTWRVRSFSHRRTQMNRTHKGPQRH